MNLASLFYRDKIIKSGITLFLFIWAVAASTLLLLQKKEVFLFQIRDGEILPISSISKIDKNEAKGSDLSFVTSFVTFYYHFDSEHFDQNMTKAMGFFSNEGWKSVASDVERLREDVSKNFISQGAVIVQARKIGPTTFKLKLKFFSALAGETKTTLKNIILNVHSRELSELSLERPYPYEVVNVSEDAN